MKIAVVTALVGNKDNLSDEQVMGKADFYCFTDRDIKSDVWTTKPACDLFKDNNRNAKIHKVLIHQYMDYDYSIWMDGNIYLLVPPEELIRRYLRKSNIALFKHFEGRNCIYKEADICIKRNLDDFDTIKEQMAKYKLEGYPENNGLFECTVILRKHTNRIKELNSLWWSEISRYSKRDQLSFNYVLSKLNIKPKKMRGHIKDNRYFRRIPHVKYEAKGIERKPLKRAGLIDVVMNRQTSWDRKILNPGMRISVPERVAIRWNNRGIAHYFDLRNLIISMQKNKKPSKYKFSRHPKVSIVVLVRNELEFIKRCFDSIYKNTADYELVVIDNGAKKETKKYLKSLNKFDLTVVTNKENMGFPYGCNQGIKISNCDYVCFLNSDTIVTPHWLDKLMLPFKQKKACGITGPSTSYCGSIQCMREILPIRYSLSEDEIYEVAESLPENTIRYDDPQGFCFVVKKELFKKTGGFDYKRFGLGCTEERELIWRICKMCNVYSYWVKDAYVHHFGHIVFDELGINPDKYNKKARLEWEQARDNLIPEFIENDVEVASVYKKSPK